MFGGVGIYADDLFVAILDNDRVFLKVDEATRAKYTERGSEPFRPTAEGPASLSYFEVPVDVLEDRTAAAGWLDEAYDAAQRAAAKKKRRSPAKR